MVDVAEGPFQIQIVIQKVRVAVLSKIKIGQQVVTSAEAIGAGGDDVVGGIQAEASEDRALAGAGLVWIAHFENTDPTCIGVVAKSAAQAEMPGAGGPTG